jgi:aspartyl-tRNA(Asn)/glutamyl-tRNA(Gln) amidotransferase subunit B
MRSKEEAHDYRYFPEPDLPPLRIPAGYVGRIERDLPELPRAKLQRFGSTHGLPAYDAKILVGDRALADLFEKVQAAYKGPAKKLSNWFLGELLRLMKEEATDVGALRFSPTQFASLLEMVDAGDLSNNAAKDVFAEMFRTGRSPRDVAQEKGLIQVQDSGAVDAAVEAVLAANPGEVEKYRSGKKQVLGFLVGQVMKAMKGKGNPALVNAALKAKLGD